MVNDPGMKTIPDQVSAKEERMVHFRVQRACFPLTPAPWNRWQRCCSGDAMQLLWENI
jgi:hypothetical protein